MFDISSLTVDPTQRGAIMAENNAAIVTTAARAQTNLRELERTSVQANALQKDKILQDLLFEQSSAEQVSQTVAAGTDAIYQLRQAEERLVDLQTTQLGRMSELRTMLDDPNFIQNQDRKTIRQAKKEYNKLNKQALEPDKLLSVVRERMASTAQSTAQVADIRVQELKLRKQAKDNVEVTSQMLDLDNKLKEIKMKFDTDNTLLQYVTQRQMLSAQEVGVGQELNSDLNEFWWDVTTNFSSKDRYGKAQAVQMRDLRESLGAGYNQAMAKVFPHWLRAKAAGVPLTSDQYKIIVANEGDADSLEALAMLTGDNDITETIQLGRQSAYSAKIQAYTEAAQRDLPVGEQLPAATIKAIEAQASKETAQMRAADILATAGQVVKSDVVNNASARGQDLLSSVAEDAGSLLNPMIYGQEMRDWFKAPEVQTILKTPNSEDGAPLLTTADKLVQALRSTGVAQDDGQAVRIVSDLIGSAAKADYKTRSDLGNNQYSRESRALERLGIGYGSGVIGAAPTHSKLRNAKQLRNYDDATDLALALEELRKFRKDADWRGRWEVQTVPGSLSPTEAVSRGLSTFQR